MNATAAWPVAGVGPAKPVFQRAVAYGAWQMIEWHRRTHTQFDRQCRLGRRRPSRGRCRRRCTECAHAEQRRRAERQPNRAERRVEHRSGDAPDSRERTAIVAPPAPHSQRRLHRKSSSGSPTSPPSPEATARVRREALTTATAWSSRDGWLQPWPPLFHGSEQNGEARQHGARSWPATDDRVGASGGRLRTVCLSYGRQAQRPRSAQRSPNPSGRRTGTAPSPCVSHPTPSARRPGRSAPRARPARPARTATAPSTGRRRRW